MNNSTEELKSGKILPLVFKLTIPAVIAQLITFLYNIVDNLSYLQNKEIKYAQIIENSLSYNPYGKCSMFRLKVQSNNENDFTVFSVNAYVGKNTEYQQAPVIVLSAMGGMS